MIEINFVTVCTTMSPHKSEHGFSTECQGTYSLRTWLAHCIAFSSVCALFLFCTPAHSQAVVTTTVSAVSAEGAAFFVLFTPNATGGPACATQTDRFAVNSTTPQGAAMIAVILSAYATGASIQIHGAGVCDAWPDTETISFAVANKPGI